MGKDSDDYKDGLDTLLSVEARCKAEVGRRSCQLQEFIGKLFHGQYEVRLTQIEKEPVIYYKGYET